MTLEPTNVDWSAVPRGDGPFERLLYALCMERGMAVEALEPDLAVLRRNRASGWAVLVRFRPEMAENLRQRLKPLLAKAAASAEVEVALVGGPAEARRVLSGAAPFFSTHRVYLYHHPDGGKPWRNTLLSPAKAVVFQQIKRLKQDAGPAPDWSAFREKLVRDQEALSAEQEEVQVFAARRHAPVATYALLAILTAVFMLEVWLGGSEDGLVLIRMGGLVPESVRGGRWWRLLSCTFLHAGFKHFLFNAYVLFALGSSLERLMGARRFLTLYGVSAIGGSAASAFLAGHTLSVGASGALWGLLVAEAVLAYRPQGLLPEAIAAPMRRATLVNLALNLMVSFQPNVDMAAHLGGGSAGALLLLSGVLTRGLPRLDEHQAAEGLSPEREQEPAWLAPAAGLVVLLAALSVASALVRGRAWIKDLAGEDPAHRAALYEDGCAGGDATSCFYLGVFYDQGEGVPKDAAHAVAFYERACDAGAATGCFNLGVSYGRGEGVPKDAARAAAYYTQACDGGEAKGCSNLGVRSATGEGVPKDAARAAALYKRACDAGEATGCLNLGVSAETGEGVPKDAARAAVLYQQACEGGEATACLNLGVNSQTGEGVPKDAARAAALYKQACEGGESRGCLYLGWLHYGGEGVEEDPVRASVLYRQACDGGELRGCFNLGSLHLDGDGVAQDAAMAAALYEQACDGGVSQACEALKQLR